MKSLFLKRAHSVAKIVCLSAIILPISAHAQLINIEQIKSSWGLVLGGAATSIAAHELGHFMVAEHEDADAYFDNITVKYRHTDGSDKQNLRLSSAGYQTQWLTSELGFYQLNQANISDNKRAWNAGLVIGHLGITAAYLTFLKDHEDGDARGVSSATDISTDKIVALLAIPALLDSWRLFGQNTPKWASWTSQGFKAVGISAIWQF